MINANKNLLLIGASRGLGLALAKEDLDRAWHVVATIRSTTKTGLDELAEKSGGQFEVEVVDTNYPDQVSALSTRLASRRFGMQFVNAGVKNDDRETIADVSTDEFVRVMVTNALSPMGVIETPPQGRSTNPATPGSGLGKNRYGRSTSAFEHRGKHSEPRQHHSRTRRC
jgi:NAD(P)-dependent dehydrogenase (short-subunit alcohol dehydrogenase family)